MSEENQSTQETTETAVDTQSTETQQVETQSTQQEDTGQQSASLSDSMKVEAAQESETSSTDQPTIDDIVNEVLSGEVSEETQKLIEENGLSKHLDMIVKGHQLEQEKNNQEVFSVVGGEAQYKELQEWGKNNMTKEEQAAFNDALFSGNLNLAKLAVQGLNAQYIAKNGKSPDKVLEGGSTANESNRPYSSQMEYIKATQSIEFKRNPEVRREVEARRNLSGF